MADLDALLAARGYEPFPPPSRIWPGIVRAWGRRLPGATPCAHNGHTSAHVYEWDNRDLDPRASRSYEVRITQAYRRDRWCELRAYGLSADELAGDLPDIERRMAAAWEAMAHG